MTTTISDPKPVRFRFAIKTWGAALFRCRIDPDVNLSHRDVAVRVGTSKRVVKEWEAGVSYPDGLQLKKLYASMRKLAQFEDLLPRAVETPEATVAWEGVLEAPPAELEDPKTFGEALRLARQVEGLSQDEVGELLGTTGQAVSLWELDQNVPVRDHYDKLLELFPALASAPAPSVQDIPKPSNHGRHEVTALAVVRPAEVAPPPAPPRDLTVSELGQLYAESLTRRELRRRRVEQLRRELEDTSSRIRAALLAAEGDEEASGSEVEEAHAALLEASRRGGSDGR